MSNQSQHRIVISIPQCLQLNYGGLWQCRLLSNKAMRMLQLADCRRGVAIMIGGPALVQYVTPSEEELFKVLPYRLPSLSASRNDRRVSFLDLQNYYSRPRRCRQKLRGNLKQSWTKAMIPHRSAESRGVRPPTQASSLTLAQVRIAG